MGALAEPLADQGRTPRLLEVRALTRRFGGIVAVDAIDLDVAEGEVVSVIGPNGAGKTTLFNLVTGHDRPDAGTVRFAGQDLNGAHAVQVAAKGLARTFQHGPWCRAEEPLTTLAAS